jgi:hypothetical protein
MGAKIGVFLRASDFYIYLLAGVVLAGPLDLIALLHARIAALRLC